MTLVIAEKPQLGRLIADAIPGIGKEVNGVIEKGDYTIIWAYGHLLELKMPEEYDPALGKWEMSTLPIFFDNWQVRPKTPSGKGTTADERIRQIAGYIKKADKVINAGDPDDEGQLLIDEILRYCNCKKPVYRMETGDTTIPALQRALQNLDPNSKHEDAGWSAYARSVADLTVGVNLSRYFTIYNGGSTLTIGRVQTPTLGLVVARDLLIESHKKIEYFVVKATLDIQGKLVPCKYDPAKDDPNLTDGRILNESYANSRVAMLENEVLHGIKVTATKIVEQPPLPCDLVELQTACGQRYGYPPQQVMDITQSLRDNYSAITYNRSECRYLSDNHFDEAPDTMDTVMHNIGFKPKGLDMTIRSKAFDSSKVDAHFAIIPQNKHLDISAFTEQERNVYMTIVKYYMAQFMPPAEKIRTKLECPLTDGGRLVSTSTLITKKGYLVLFAKDKKENQDDEEETASPLSELGVGTYTGSVVSTGTEKKETKPPARYTQTSLNKDMTRISKYVDDPAIKKLLIEKDNGKVGENGSIGTVATRASIITNLISRGFLKDDGKHVISTPLGRELIRILPNELKKPDMTAEWWVIQQDISAGKVPYTTLTDSVLDMVKRIIKTQYPKIDPSVLPAQRSKGRNQVGICPRCGKPVVEGKLGFGCVGYKEGCKFTIWKKSKLNVFKNITITEANAKALLAGKKIKKSGLISKNGKTFEAYLSLRPNSNSEYGAEFDMSFPEKKGSGKKKE